MKKPILFSVILMFGSCQKNDVDVSTLVTNPADADFAGGNVLFTVDSVVTRATIPNAVYEQNVHVTVNVDRFPHPQAYQVWLVEETSPDTAIYYSSQHPNNVVVCDNYQLTLGYTYCYRVQLRISNEVVREEHVCALAEL
jgi:hypothetical protein